MATAMKACIEMCARDTDGGCSVVEYSVMYSHQGEKIEDFVHRILNVMYAARSGYGVVRFTVWHYGVCVTRAMYALDARGCWQREMWL